MTDIEKLHQRAIFLQKKDAYWRKWGVWGVVAYLRDQGIRQYCDCNLFENFESLFGKQVLDHLLPTTKYPHLEVQIWNLVTSCALCNNLKLHWDPNRDGGPIVYDESASISLSEIQYLELLNRARRFVGQRRKAKADEFQSARDSFQGALSSAEH